MESITLDTNEASLIALALGDKIKGDKEIAERLRSDNPELAECFDRQAKRGEALRDLICETFGV